VVFRVSALVGDGPGLGRGVAGVPMRSAAGLDGSARDVRSGMAGSASGPLYKLERHTARDRRAAAGQ
jgi:hypothetical protein